MFEVNTISGRENSIGMSIYLVPIDQSNVKPVSPTQSAILSVKNIDGFGLTIPQGTASFDSGTSGSVSVSQVHKDRVPMPPPNGMNPKIVFTIQPEDVRFDPPAPIVYPNVYGYPPGKIVNLYSFDHDLGQWVSIGTGSVTEDGAFIASDPGVGIIHGGWHFPEPPPEPTTDTEGEIEEPFGPPPPPCPVSGMINPVSGSDGTLAHRSPGRQGDGRYSETGEFRTDAQGNPRKHLGVDIVAPVDTPIVAGATGRIVRKTFDPATAPTTPRENRTAQAGNMIVIDYGNGNFGKYMHLNRFAFVDVGDTVNANTIIGFVGTSGNASNTDQPHLHLEIRQGGYDQNLDPSVNPIGCIFQ